MPVNRKLNSFAIQSLNNFVAALLVCLIAYVFSTLDEFSPIKVANLLMYLMLASSELLLFNFNAELLKQHVRAPPVK